MCAYKVEFHSAKLCTYSHDGDTRTHTHQLLLTHTWLHAHMHTHTQAITCRAVGSKILVVRPIIGTGETVRDHYCFAGACKEVHAHT